MTLEFLDFFLDARIIVPFQCCFLSYLDTEFINAKQFVAVNSHVVYGLPWFPWQIRELVDFKGKQEAQNACNFNRRNSRIN